MGWIQELRDLIKEFSFYEIVYEYQQGLFFRAGKAIEVRRRKFKENELERIVAEEKQAINLITGNKRLKKLLYYIPFARPKLPEKYKRSFWTGKPLHPARFSKILDPGLYFFLPIVEEIVKDSQQEQVLNLESISVPTTDDRIITVSANIRFYVHDYFKAYTAVHDFRKSLKDHSLSILSECSIGKAYDDWKKPEFIKSLSGMVETELRKIVTRNWGISIQQVYITDHAESRYIKHVHEANRINVDMNKEEGYSI